MRFANATFFSLIVCSTTGGCHCFQSIEQWKCNHFGMCHFGTRPTNAPYYPYNTPTYPPAYAPLPATAAQPAALGGAQPVIVSPPPMNVSPSAPTSYPSSVGVPSGAAASGLGYAIPQTYSPPAKQPCQ